MGSGGSRRDPCADGEIMREIGKRAVAEILLAQLERALRLGLGIRISKRKKTETEATFVRLDKRGDERAAKLRKAVSGKGDSDRTVFVYDFRPSLRAGEVEQLREAVDLLIRAAEEKDEVVIKLTSPGGTVNGYGHAASQLQRLRDHGIRVTVCIDEMAASGGYMCACIADKIVAAPLAYIGSIGVVAEFPNFSAMLERVGVRWMELTAGDAKRTVGMFSEPTEEKTQFEMQRLVRIHELFKAHVAKYRSAADIQTIATGNWWVGEDAKRLGLVDEIMTSDEYLYQSESAANIISVSVDEPEKGLLSKLF